MQTEEDKKENDKYMKIGILTFHASHNYGSMLQAYALQKYLESIGCDSEIINFRSIKQKRLYKFPLLPIIDRKKAYIDYATSLINPIWLFHECRKWKKYEDFIERYLKLSEKQYSSWEEIRKDIPILGYDVIITGGDQIWNMRCKDFDKSYYLPSQFINIKKVSYAPSFGGRFLSRIKENEETFIKTHLTDYNVITVREDGMKNYLSDLLNKKVDVTVDPTMLLSVEDYKEVSLNKPIVDSDYIYYYSPFPKPHAERLAILIGQYLGLKVITSFPHKFNKKRLCAVHETGPSEFLNLLKNATLVIGKSFHLVVFSLLFHKNFIAIDGNKDARINNILKSYNIIERGMVNENNYKSIPLPPIDFKMVDDIISQQRNKSKEFITDFLQLS